MVGVYLAQGSLPRGALLDACWDECGFCPATTAGSGLVSLLGSLLISVGVPLKVTNCDGGSSVAAMIHDLGPTGLINIAFHWMC